MDRCLDGVSAIGVAAALLVGLSSLFACRRFEGVCSSSSSFSVAFLLAITAMHEVVKRALYMLLI